MLVDSVTLQKLIPHLEEAEKFFSGNAARDDIMLMQTNIFFQLGLQDKDLMKAGTALMGQLLGTMDKEMLNIIDMYGKGRMGYAQAFKSWKGMAKDSYLKLFRSGAMAVGNPYYDQLKLTRKDIAFINGAVRAEGRYFGKFLSDVKNPKHFPVHAYEKRAGYYTNTAKAQFYNGMVAGAGNQVRIFWILGVPQTEHCGTCLVYAKNRGGQGYTWKTLPTVPRSGMTECFLSNRVGIYTSRGLRRVNKLKPGDLVLTHKGRYRKVNHVWQHPYEDDAVHLKFRFRDGTFVNLVVTPTHKLFMPDGTWKEAKDLSKGKKVSVVAQKCPNCGKIFVLSDWNKECCSLSCSSKYYNKIRKGRETITKLQKEGKFTHSRRDRLGKTYEQIYGNDEAAGEKKKRSEALKGKPSLVKGKTYEQIMGKNRAEARKEKQSRAKKGKTYEQITTPERAKKWRERIGDVRRGKTLVEIYGKEKAEELLQIFKKTHTTLWMQPTSIELGLRAILDGLGLGYIEQERIEDFCTPDFFIPEYNIALEADGEHWHNFPYGTDRDREVVSRLNSKGITVLRFWGSDILKRPNAVRDEIQRVVRNHKGNYILDEAEVVGFKITRKPRIKYDLEVDEDHSYVVKKGIVSHNCLFRCHCSLDIRPPVAKHRQSPNKGGSLDALTAGGRYGRVFGSDGVEIGGELQRSFEAIYARMYKARQMAEVTTGAEKLKWIAARRELNKTLIDLQGTKYRAVPTISVKDLSATVRSAMKKGGTLVDDLTALVAGDELAFVRGDYSALGVLRTEGGRLMFVDPNGIKVRIESETDIMFLIRTANIVRTGAGTE